MGGYRKIKDLCDVNLKGDLDEAHVERVGRELVSAGAIVDLYKDAIRLPNGEIHYWDMVSHRKGAAAIVAVRDDGKLLMVRQYRPALNRELEVETGLIPNDMKHLLSLKTTVAFCDEFIEVYLSRGLHDRKEQMLDDAESIDIIACDLDDLIDLIFDGTIQDSKTVSGILAYYKLVREK